MITKEQAETTCIEIVTKYLDDAHPASADDVANLLTKLVGVAANEMFKRVGTEETLNRMIAATAVACGMPVPDAIVVERRPKPETAH